ncbi:MAG TPA: hypothetical protein VGP93_03445, partial [Polyangiaceae bacterium]|nr:hypothetical protein [Polyangiaceae bacterium]
EGLEHLKRVGALIIADNPRLIGIGALNGVASVDRVALKHNPRLCAYYGLLRGLSREPAQATVVENRGLSAEESASLAPSKSRQVAAR